MKATAGTKPAKKRRQLLVLSVSLTVRVINMSLHRVREAFGIFNSDEVDIGTKGARLHGLQSAA